MKVALIQMAVKQSDFDANIKKADELAKKAKELGAQLAVFPEMFVCGFGYRKNLEYLKNHGNKSEKEISKIAKKYNIAICGSVPHLEEGEEKPSNRMIFFRADGTPIAHYDKAHLFGVFNEDKFIKRGNKVVVCDTPFGRAGFAICYDLRFPEIFTKMAQLGAKFVILSAAFPHPRMGHWRILSKARAIENQFFMLATNQGGEENFGNPDSDVKYFGRSAAIDPWGEVVAECPVDTPDAIAIADINLEDVDAIRDKIPAIADRRPEIY